MVRTISFNEATKHRHVDKYLEELPFIILVVFVRAQLSEVELFLMLRGLIVAEELDEEGQEFTADVANLRFR